MSASLFAYFFYLHTLFYVLSPLSPLSSFFSLLSSLFSFLWATCSVGLLGLGECEPVLQASHLAVAHLDFAAVEEYRVLDNR